MMPSLRLLLLPLLTLAMLLLSAAAGIGEEAAGQAGPLGRQFEQRVRELDSDQFAVRKMAAAQLDEWAAQPELARPLAKEVQRVLLQPSLSFEVRNRLENLMRALPKIESPPAGAAPEGEIERLVGQLESDAYGERLGAVRRLEWLLTSPEMVSTVMMRLRSRLLEGDLSPDARQWIEPMDRRARAAWLSSDPAKWRLPEISDGQIAAWLDDLARPVPEGDPARQHANHAARRRLLDLLAQDDYVPRLKEALEKKLAESGLDGAGAAQLREMLDLTRPALIAEFWTDRQNLGTQYLIVGVPSLGPGAERPSHFDRADDRTAHCVSGNSLSPGDYPVGVAIPHPKQENALFHLVNLPTPRRRMAYEYHRKLDEATRLAELTRRTTERVLAENRHLTEEELVRLPQLDLDLASAFAARLLTAIEDRPLPQEGPQRFSGRPSHHGMLCAFLAAEGTKAAVAPLLEAIRTNRVLPPTDSAPYRMDWLAALSIAVADPWPEADSWLIGLIDRTDPLIHGRQDSPELGATAAATLIEKHQQPLFAFGLEPIADRILEIFGVRGCRFSSDDARRSVRRWWNERREPAKVQPQASP